MDPQLTGERYEGDQKTTEKSSTLQPVQATPSSRNRAICLRPMAPNFKVLMTPCAATTRNHGSRDDSSDVSRAKTNATCRGVR